MEVGYREESSCYIEKIFFFFKEFFFEERPLKQLLFDGNAWPALRPPQFPTLDVERWRESGAVFGVGGEIAMLQEQTLDREQYLKLMREREFGVSSLDSLPSVTGSVTGHSESRDSESAGPPLESRDNDEETEEVMNEGEKSRANDENKNGENGEDNSRSEKNIGEKNKLRKTIVDLRKRQQRNSVISVFEELLSTIKSSFIILLRPDLRTSTQLLGIYSRKV